MPLLGRGLSTQLRVVHALALRETRTRFGRFRLGYLWALLEPVVWIGTFAALYLAIGRETADRMALVPFLASGIVPYQLCIGTSDRVCSAIDGNRALLFYPQVQPIDLVYARVLLELATYVSILALLLGGWSLYDPSFRLGDVLTLALGLGLATALGGALGLVLCAAAVLSPTVLRLKTPLLRPLFWVSGLFFAASMLPTPVRDLLLWNPVLHCVELVRDGCFASYEARHASPGYVLAWTLGLALLGLSLERAVRPRIQLT